MWHLGVHLVFLLVLFLLDELVHGIVVELHDSATCGMAIMSPASSATVAFAHAMLRSASSAFANVLYLHTDLKIRSSTFFN